MLDCEKVDPKNLESYGITASVAITEMAVREEHFIRRHGLAQQFLDEDTAGKR